MKSAGPGAFFKFPEAGEVAATENGGAAGFGDAGNDDSLYD
jgi:transitional endoplasmic reticulum ATPase